MYTNIPPAGVVHGGEILFKMNKFINKYPVLWSPAIGDKFRVRCVLNSFKEPVPDNHYNYKIGEIGVITHKINGIHGAYTAKFNHAGSVNVWIEEIEPL